mmetsp:Transcript_24792/g.30994  ORF Transcript_24792/g.30994 Transcript_24792/m.30994 type:complete len:141 (-) Transcript_24792:11-433(-)
MTVDGRGSPRPTKKVIQETDLSDGRDEAEKIKAELEKEKTEQLENIRLMNEWKKKQEEKEKEGSATNEIIDKMRIDQARLRQDAEDSADSSSLSVPTKGASGSKPVEESYTTDEFEDVSMSGSGSKKLDLWSGKAKASAD